MSTRQEYDAMLDQFDPEVREQVEDVCMDAACHLVENLPKLVEKTLEARKQSSVTPTYTIKPARGDQVEILFTPRLRHPDKATSVKLRLENGQLAFGWKEQNTKPEDDDKSPEAQEARKDDEPELPLGDGEKTDPADPFPDMEKPGFNAGAQTEREPVKIDPKRKASATPTQAERLALINQSNAKTLERVESGELEMSEADADRLRELVHGEGQPSA